MRTMLYFGSFNPVHNGHLAIAEYVVGQNLCDRLLLVISPQNPFKQECELMDEAHRLEMVRLGLQSCAHADRMEVCDVEFTLPKPSYTIDTLRVLEKQHPSDRFYLLMGSDNVDGLSRWKEYRTLLDNYPVFVYPRAGYESAKFRDRITVLGDAPRMEVCSTEVREKICRGEDVSGLIPAAVLHYIKSNELWKTTSDCKTR